MKAVRIDPTTFTHTLNAKGEPTGKARSQRAYALINEDGSPIFVGLFATEAAAREYCKARGWRLVK